ncbi:MAG: ABC transporter permease [Clostridia bacterium]|nr:ABC transporter permease [Clostridia bacterium]
MKSIIKSHFHKGKTGFVITGLFIILSVLMMIIGLSICFGIDTLYQKARDISNSPDCCISVFESPGGESQARIEEVLKSTEYVENYDLQEKYYLEKEEGENTDKRLEFYTRTYIGNMFVSNWVALNIDDENNAFKPQLRDTVEKEGYKFYVTGNFIATTMFSVGDNVKTTINGKTYKGYIAGIYDDMTRIYDTANIYVSGDLFEEIAKQSEDDGRITREYNFNIRIDSKDETESAKLQLQLCKELESVIVQLNIDRLSQDPTLPYIYCNYATRDTFTQGTKSFILLLGTALVAFSVIVAIIVAIVIGFLVRSSVFDEVRNLGVLKALGYTTTQLRLSYLAIYGVICGICMLIGVALGIGLMPAFVNVVTGMARLDCSKAISVNVGGIFVAVAFVLSVVSSVVYLSTAKVKSVTPLSAMRNNVQTHSFRHNRAPLDKSKININAYLGIKSVVGETHRSVMVISIVLIMSLLCSFVSVVFYNLKVDQTAIINMSAMENADYYINFSNDDKSPYFDAIHNIDGFEAEVLSTGVGLEIDGKYGQGRLYENFDHMRTKMVYKGRYPKYANEILIDYAYATEKGYKLGDSVTLHMDRDTVVSDKSCVIVGYFQNLLDMCKVVGFLEILDELYDIPTLEESRYVQHLIYFEKGKAPNIDELREILMQVDGGKVMFNGFQTGEDYIGRAFLNTVETAADAVMSVFFSITAIVIALLLVMLIKLKLLRERRNYAVYKALGYTSFGIMLQIATSMLLLGLVGSIIGALIGSLTTSPILSLFGKYIGAGHFAFIIPWGYTVCVVLFICALICAVSMLCAIPVRKINPAKHLRERG